MLLSARSKISTLAPISSTRLRKTSSARVSAVARDAPWFPGYPAPAHLTGKLPGDFGFDPLGLGADPARLAWNQQAELVHGRFAMWASAGILGPELLTNLGVNWPGAGVAWYDAGAFDGYFTTPGTLLVVQILLLAWVENLRLSDIKNPGSVGGDPIFTNNKLPAGDVGYPGGIFLFADFLGKGKGDQTEVRLKEIKNGRLAMLSVLGYFVQHQVTGSTPLADLSAHLANPWGTTVLSNLSSLFVWQWTDPSFLSSLSVVKSLPFQ